MTYTTMLLLVSILVSAIMAKTCLRYIRLVRLLKQVSRELITIDARRRGTHLTPRQAEAELLEYLKDRDQLTAA